MPLSQAEWDFLEAYIYEATHGPPFGGPATRELANKDVYYTDLLWLLTAYNREGRAAGRSPFGVQNLSPPLSPWADREEVRRRCEQLRAEYEPRIRKQAAAIAGKAS